VVKLLRVGLSSSERTVDRIVSRLRQPDGAAWFAGTLPDDLGRDLFVPGSPAASPEALQAAKERCKALFERTGDSDQVDRALLRYYVCIAAALAHHGQLITGRPLDEVCAALVDLAEVSPAPWNDLFMKAAATTPSGAPRGGARAPC
jgi:hypothetical protein